MLGAAGVQIGTVFMATPECMASDAHKQAMQAASGDDTMISKAFSGRNARSLVNDYAAEMDRVMDWPDFSLMNTLTGPLRSASAKQGKPDAIALWSGQAVGLIHGLVKRLKCQHRQNRAEYLLSCDSHFGSHSRDDCGLIKRPA